MSNEQSKFVRVCRKVKHLSYAFILGSVVMAYGAWNYASAALDHVQQISMRGFCRQLDVDHQAYWAACSNPDALIAAQVQQNDIEYDRAGLDALVKKGGRK